MAPVGMRLLFYAILLLSFIGLPLLCPCAVKARAIDAVKENSELIKQVIYKNGDGGCGPYQANNSRPLIGILSQPGDGAGGVIIERNGWNASTASYIAASYVKLVEMGGGRAVPILYNDPEDVLAQKFAAINGILFPGGSASLKRGPFYLTAEKLFKMALKANDNGDYFPILGICLGFELLCVLVTQNHGIRERFNAKYYPAPLYFESENAKHCNLFKWASPRVIEKASKESLAMENHQYGFSPQNFSANSQLSSFFRVLTTSPDKSNKLYISTVEGRNYPITGVQWHPEKTPFEWIVPSIPHTPEAIQLSQSVANFFINEARRSNHQPSKDAEDEFLIYNYSPFYVGKNRVSDFEQTYIFA